MPFPSIWIRSHHKYPRHKRDNSSCWSLDFFICAPVKYSLPVYLSVGGFRGGGGLRGLHPPPPIWSENFTNKRSFLPFLGLQPPFPDRMVDKRSHQSWEDVYVDRAAAIPPLYVKTFVDLPMYNMTDETDFRTLFAYYSYISFLIVLFLVIFYI